VKNQQPNGAFPSQQTWCEHQKILILHYPGLEYYNHHTYFAKAQSIKTMAELPSLMPCSPRRGRTLMLKKVATLQCILEHE
jgi:hypothetical protein